MHSALDAMFGLDDVIELRAFPKGRRRTIAGYFDAEHRGDLVKQAFQLNMNGALCYITLNSIDPQLLGRYRNRVQEYADATTSDKDVIRRRWLLLDFDPIRPRDTPATKAQLDAAHERCRACAEHLATLGWPAPITALSGNGLHLYYAIDLPNDPETTELIKGALAALAEQFDTDKVLLDQSVFNPSRVTKLTGTVTTKGDHTPAMPWRLSQLLEVPDRGAVVTAEQLKALHPPHKGNGAAVADSFSGFDLPAFLGRLEAATRITCHSQDMHNGAERYRLSACPFNPDHGPGKAVVLKLTSGALVFKCQSGSCSKRKWQDVRALVDGPRETRASSRNEDLASPRLARKLAQ
jgi:hypothetical protein